VSLAGLFGCHIHLVKSFYSLSVVSKSIGSDQFVRLSIYFEDDDYSGVLKWRKSAIDFQNINVGDSIVIYGSSCEFGYVVDNDIMPKPQTSANFLCQRHEDACQFKPA